MNEDEEILDLVDASDKVIGQIRRAELDSLLGDGSRFVRSVDLFIIRSDGKIWVPTRTLHKKIAPGGLDYSVGGHVLSGETYEQAIIRELAEEASITVTPEELEYIATPPPFDYYISPLYVLRSDTQPALSSEHTDGQWLTIDELKNKLESGARAKESLPPKLLLLEEHVNKGL